MIYKIKKINVDKNNTIKMEKNAKTQSLQSKLRDNNKIICKFWKGIIIVNLDKIVNFLYSNQENKDNNLNITKNTFFNFKTLKKKETWRCNIILLKMKDYLHYYIIEMCCVNLKIIIIVK